MCAFVQSPLSIYLHIPFCTTKCTYCAFNTYTNLEELIPAFVDALCREVEIVAQGNPYLNVHTIFFGGGTPSLLSPKQFEQLLRTIYDHFDVVPHAEVTTEANPNDLDFDYLYDLRSAGVNRLSIGMQTADTLELTLFERRHDHRDVISAVKNARQAGFDNISLDLIYGFPNQTLVTWQSSLQQTIALEPEHLSLYALGLEEGTSLFNQVHLGTLKMPEDDLAADMYEWASDALASHGYEQYEISNWAKPGYACQHNRQYWENAPYLGLGPGAHGYAGGWRYATLLFPQRYIKAMREAKLSEFAFPQTPATREANNVTWEDEVAETLITSLRLLDTGVSLSGFKRRFGTGLYALHGQTIERFIADGLLQADEERVRLTQRGRLLCNRVFREFV